VVGDPMSEILVVMGTLCAASQAKLAPMPIIVGRAKKAGLIPLLNGPVGPIGLLIKTCLFCLEPSSSQRN